MELTKRKYQNTDVSLKVHFRFIFNYKDMILWHLLHLYLENLF